MFAPRSDVGKSRNVAIVPRVWKLLSPYFGSIAAAYFLITVLRMAGAPRHKQSERARDGFANSMMFYGDMVENVARMLTLPHWLKAIPLESYYRNVVCLNRRSCRRDSTTNRSQCQLH